MIARLTLRRVALLLVLAVTPALAGCEFVVRVVFVVPPLNACVTTDQNGNPCPPNTPAAQPALQRRIGAR